MTATQRILLGEITGVHGIKGDVVIRSYAADPVAIADYGDLADETGTRRFQITAVRPSPKGVVARLAGIADRDEAEALRGTKLYVDRTVLPEPDDDAFYVTDLVGLSVIANDGVALGRVGAVHNFGAGDILEIELQGKAATELIPFADPYVPSVDLAAGTVTVVLPEPYPANDDHPEPDTSSQN